jgi:hypothetical protein
MPLRRWFLALMAAGLATLFAASAAQAAAPSTPAGSSSSPSVAAKTKAPQTPTAAFGIQPSAATKVDGRSAFNYGMTPGASLSDHVALVNIGTQPLKVDLYPEDAISTDKGEFSLAAADAKLTSAGAWIKIDAPAQVTLPPRNAKGPSVTIFPFTLKIPANASPGDHAGGLVVSLRSTAESGGAKVKQNLDQRVGTRVYIRVSGPVRPALTIEGLHGSFGVNGTPVNPAGSGTVNMTYTVHNTGNVILGANQAASVSSWFGASAQAKGLGAIPPLLPGASLVVHATVKGVYPGIRLTAKVKLSPTVPTGAVDPGVTTASASVSLWAIPWPLVVIVLLILCGVGYLAWRRWGPHKPKGNPPPAPKPTLGKQPTPVG